MWGIKLKGTSSQDKQTNKNSDTDNGLVVSRGKGRECGGRKGQRVSNTW